MRKVWPGILIDRLDKVEEFEAWFENLGGTGRYIGMNLKLPDGQLARPGDMLVLDEGVWAVEVIK